jgi:hypothetical protein
MNPALARVLASTTSTLPPQKQARADTLAIAPHESAQTGANPLYGKGQTVAAGTDAHASAPAGGLPLPGRAALSKKLKVSRKHVELSRKAVPTIETAVVTADATMLDAPLSTEADFPAASAAGASSTDLSSVAPQPHASPAPIIGKAKSAKKKKTKSRRSETTGPLFSAAPIAFEEPAVLQEE